MITYQIEQWSDFVGDATPIFYDHWKEVALYQDKIPLSVDDEKYRVMENAGLLHIVTARDDGALVGYFLSIMSVHPHYKEHSYAVNDVLYVVPDGRGSDIAVDMFKFAETELKKLDISVIVLHMKVKKTFKSLVDYLGYDHAEMIYTKYIGK